MAATSHPLAAQVALETLKSGGNAMDAAIAGAVLLGICEPQSTGIGGDLFALWSEGGSDVVQAYNGSGRAPAATDAGALRAKGLREIDLKSAHAVTLPGAVDAFCNLSERHGRLGIDRLLAPAIHYGEVGVPVAPRVAFDWHNSQGVLQGPARDIYLSGGRPYETGSIFANPKMSAALRKIAKLGRDGFYDGDVAEDMLSVLTQNGGCHSAEDFGSVATDYSDPISAAYKTAEVVEHPPNGQGATALLILNILGHFNLGDMDPFGADRTHLEIEATKAGYSLRNQLIADPRNDRSDIMLDPATAARIASAIDPKRAGPWGVSPTGAPHKDTVYITVVDEDRMAVSLIYSIFHSFGTGLAGPNYGILMQNRGGGFSLDAGHPNELGAGKRPLHTIIPGMVRREGRIEMPFGVMGGSYQANGHARFISNLEDFGMDPQAAIDGPRCFPENGQVRMERGYSDAVKADLSDRGHSLQTADAPIGGAQAIRIRADGVLVGGSDPRKDGCAIGY